MVMVAAERLENRKTFTFQSFPIASLFPGFELPGTVPEKSTQGQTIPLRKGLLAHPLWILRKNPGFVLIRHTVILNGSLTLVLQFAIAPSFAPSGYEWAYPLSGERQLRPAPAKL